MNQMMCESIRATSGDFREQPWTSDATQFLRRMRRRGKSFGWIARALGTTRDACIDRAVALNIARPKVRPATREALAAGEPPALGASREILEGAVCRWIVGELDQPDWRMCGHRALQDSSWCAHHFARVTGRGGRG